MHTTLLMVSSSGVELDFPAWLRITHFINFLMMGFLIRSGWEVIASHPRFYWNNHCTPGSECSVLRRTRFRPSLANTPLATSTKPLPSYFATR